LTAPDGRTYTTQKSVPASKAFTTVPHTYSKNGKVCTTYETVPDADVSTTRRTETFTSHGRTYTTVVEEPTITFQPWTSKYTRGNMHYTVYHDKSSTAEDVWEDTPSYYEEPEDLGWGITSPPPSEYSLPPPLTQGSVTVTETLTAPNGRTYTTTK
jgi:hypothetical protein